MTQLATVFPTRIGNGAKRASRWDVEVVRTDGGREVRNNRWSAPLTTYTVPMPVNISDDDVDLVAILDLWEEAEGSTHSFWYYDDLKGENVAVRFDDDLQISDIVGSYRQFESIILQEVRA